MTNEQLPDFSNLPATRIELNESVKANGNSYYGLPQVIVQSLDNGDGSRIIRSQQEGKEWVTEMKSKFGTMAAMKQWAESYTKLKGEWCNAVSAD